VASLIAIGGFLAGALAGGRLAARLADRPHRWLAVAIGAEASLLALVAILTTAGVLPFSGHGDYATVVLAVALGVQNSTVRHFGVPDLTTAVLSLTLTAWPPTAPSSAAAVPGPPPARVGRRHAGRRGDRRRAAPGEPESPSRR
jgi:uncharacterized protein DUF1275